MFIEAVIADGDLLGKLYDTFSDPIESAIKAVLSDLDVFKSMDEESRDYILDYLVSRNSHNVMDAIMYFIVHIGDEALRRIRERSVKEGYPKDVSDFASHAYIMKYEDGVVMRAKEEHKNYLVTLTSIMRKYLDDIYSDLPGYITKVNAKGTVAGNDVERFVNDILRPIKEFLELDTYVGIFERIEAVSRDVDDWIVDAYTSWVMRGIPR